MPLWQIYHPENTFSNVESKQALVSDIKKMYTPSLPAFYVVAQFFPLSKDDYWVGGDNQLEKPFIRVVINHVAITGAANAKDNQDAFYKRATEKIDDVLKPHVADKGYDWEYHVSETDRRLWKTNGLIPPPFQSTAEEEWKKLNRPVPWQGDH